MAVVYNFVYMILKYSEQAAFISAYCCSCITGPSQVQTCLESYLKFVFSGTLVSFHVTLQIYGLILKWKMISIQTSIQCLKASQHLEDSFGEGPELTVLKVSTVQ